MGNCWSCGSPVGGLHYTFKCPACAETAVLKDISKSVIRQNDAMEILASGLSNMTNAVSSGLLKISDELSTLAGIIEGGFEELSWELQQQTEILLSIDQTLKTPSQTQAREWREMAEQLRKRGCLDEAEKWFLKSFEMSPLDYRTYIGLAFNYLRKNDFDEAEEILKKSFPHAPLGEKPKEIVELMDEKDRLKEIAKLIGEKMREITDENLRLIYYHFLNENQKKQKKEFFHFDYKSLSYELIGRIYSCRGDYKRAVTELRSAIDLTPDYPEGNYNYALYCIQSGMKSGWEDPLLCAISAQPGYFSVAWAERRFLPVRQELNKLLSGLLNEAYQNAAQAIRDAETKLAEAQCSIANAPNKAGCQHLINEFSILLTDAKSNLASKNYVKMLKVSAGAARAAKLFVEISQQAKDSIIAFNKERKRRLWEAIDKTVPKLIYLVAVIFVIMMFFGKKFGHEVAWSFILLGAIIGLGMIKFKLRKKY